MPSDAGEYLPSDQEAAAPAASIRIGRDGRKRVAVKKLPLSHFIDPPPVQEPEDKPVVVPQAEFIVHSMLDDLPLSPVEFRIYAHAVRRGGLGGLYYESVANAAAHCRVRPDTLRRALKRLQADSLLVLVEKPAGRTWSYRVNQPEAWTVQPLPKEDPRPKSRGVLKQEGSTPETGGGSGTLKQEGTPPERGDTKVSHKAFPGRLSPERESQALAIYDAYPKHVAKPPALKAIAKALSKVPFEELLAKTQAYAEHCRRTRKDPQYVPYPATWFNRDGWDDPLDARPSTIAPPDSTF
jgi:hypothetical protein